MRKFLFFILIFYFVSAVSSCSMEKKLYRNGWYIEDSGGNIHAQNNFHQQNIISREIKPQSVFSINKIVVDNNSAIIAADKQKKPSDLNSRKTNFSEKLTGDPEEKKMTHREAVEAISKKGAKPNRAASAVYCLSIISVCTCWFGLGILLGFTTIIISIFAKNKVVADGSCIDENIAIIDAGLRICRWMFKIVTIVLILAFLAGIVWALLYGPIMGG